MDICFQVVAKDSNVADRSKGYSKGDVVIAYQASIIGNKEGGKYKLKEPLGSKRLAFLFVTEFPDTSVDKINSLLQEYEATKRRWHFNKLSYEPFKTISYLEFIGNMSDKSGKAKTMLQEIK